MDLIKTLLVYMIMVISGAVQAAPAVAPPTPGVNPSATPYTVTLRPATAAPTATPTLRPTAAPTATPTRYTSLYVGDRGDAVTKLQRRLAELGYLNDKIDGIFGKNTKAAVERFQYYNNLTVDGIAGQKTQAMLYESTAVVTAPPDMGTPRPTATPLRGVTVPVYYVNENSMLLYSTVITCYADTTIYANGNYVGANYELTSSGAVNVTIRNGTATPASVTFRYRTRATETPVPNVVVPIYYQDQATGRLLYSSVTAPLAPGRTHYITASAALAPAGYELVGSDTVTVVVSADGVATPPSVIFTFRNTVTEAPATEVPVTEVPATEAPITEAPATEVPVTEAPATEVPVTEAPATEVPVTEAPVTEAPVTEAPATDVPEPQYAVIPVYYMDEEGPMIGVSPIKVQYGATAQVTPESGIVNESEFALVSDAAVTVIVDANGVCAPDTVTFTYRRIVTATDVPVLESGKITVELRLQGTEEVLFSYEEEVKLNSETQVYAKYESLDPKYVPVGDTVMTVFVDASGNVNPAPVFYFADTTPAEPTVTEAPATETPAPEPQYAVVPVRYLTEDGIVLGESAVKVLYGGTMDVTPEAGMVNENDFTLVSAASVTVTADANGVCTPDTVVFTYRRVETPTEVPATDVPVTEAPATEVPATEVPATEVPVTEAPATETPAPEPQYASVPVRYLTEDGIVLGESAVKVLYGGTMDVMPEAGVVNENDFTLVSAGSVTVTADANGVCTPDAVVFTYRRVETPTEVPATEAPAPAPALTDGGYSVQIDGNTIPLNWMKDQGGNAMVSLRMLAGAAGWGYSGGNCEINGHSVAVSYDANGVYTLSVDGNSYAGSAIVFDNDLYVGLQFIRALGYDASASGSSIVMNTIAQ